LNDRPPMIVSMTHNVYRCL